MATTMATRKSGTASASIPRAMRHKVEALLEESYAFMDSPVFRQKNIERQLFDFDVEPQLPMTSWYQPTRDEALDQAMVGAQGSGDLGSLRAGVFDVLALVQNYRQPLHRAQAFADRTQLGIIEHMHVGGAQVLR